MGPRGPSPQWLLQRSKSSVNIQASIKSAFLGWHESDSGKEKFHLSQRLSSSAEKPVYISIFSRQLGSLRQAVFMIKPYFKAPVARNFLYLGFLSLTLGACGIPDSKRPTGGSSPINPSPSARQCFGELRNAGVRFSPLPNQNFSGGCSQIGAITMLDVGRGTEVSNLGPVRCELANKFAAWTEYAVRRAARQYLGSELVRIETMGSYSCRPVAGSNRLSEHGRANAIDVSGFVLADGRRITLTKYWNNGRQEKKFLRAIHQSACRRFGTVLSPDFNADHHDHFHFDMSGNGYCR